MKNHIPFERFISDLITEIILINEFYGNDLEKNIGEPFNAVNLECMGLLKEVFNPPEQKVVNIKFPRRVSTKPIKISNKNVV